MADDPGSGDASRLVHPTELDLLRLLVRFPETIVGSAVNREPHRVTGYLRDLAAAFHPFYHQCRVVGEERELAHARLKLCTAVRQVLANGLGLLHIDAPESM